MTTMTNAQIIRKLTEQGISTGEIRVAQEVRDGSLMYEDHRETVDMVENAINAIEGEA